MVVLLLLAAWWWRIVEGSSGKRAVHGGQEKEEPSYSEARGELGNNIHWNNRPSAFVFALFCWYIYGVRKE